MPSTSKCAKTSGYTPDAVAKLLKAQKSHPVKGNWMDNEVLEDVEIYTCEVVWTATKEYNDLYGDTIPAFAVKMAVPRGMQGLIKKLQSLHGRNVSSLPSAVSDHFIAANKERLDQIGLNISCNFSGNSLFFFFLNTGRWTMKRLDTGRKPMRLTVPH